MSRVVVWYSDGAASAVAAKLAVEKYRDRCVVVKCDTTSDEHADNERFRKDVERWIGRKILLIASEKYADVDAVIEGRSYMSGPHGAPCTVELKKVPRIMFQEASDIHIFGYTLDRKELKRIKNFEAANPDLTCEWILRDRFVRKVDCLRMVREAGIRMPEMYVLGYDHNNCLGCVKSNSPAYWNMVRRDFPEVFEKRCRQGRAVGARLVRVPIPMGEREWSWSEKLGKMVAPTEKRIFLDELDPTLGGVQDDIECGPICYIGDS